MVDDLSMKRIRDGVSFRKAEEADPCW